VTFLQAGLNRDSGGAVRSSRPAGLCGVGIGRERRSQSAALPVHGTHGERRARPTVPDGPDARRAEPSVPPLQSLPLRMCQGVGVLYTYR